jgi:hypothetical protein
VALRTDKKGGGIDRAVPPALKTSEVYVLFVEKKITVSISPMENAQIED